MTSDEHLRRFMDGAASDLPSSRPDLNELIRLGRRNKTRRTGAQVLGASTAVALMVVGAFALNPGPDSNTVGPTSPTASHPFVLTPAPGCCAVTDAPANKKGPPPTPPRARLLRGDRMVLTIFGDTFCEPIVRSVRLTAPDAVSIEMGRSSHVCSRATRLFHRVVKLPAALDLSGPVAVHIGSFHFQLNQ